MEIGGTSVKIRPGVTRGTKLKRFTAFHRKIENDEEKKLYSNCITFYDTPPDSTITLEEFDKYAAARLEVLRTIERVNLTAVSKYGIDWKTAVIVELNKLKDKPLLEGFKVLLINMGKEDELQQVRKLDHISHYLLRLAFARTEEQRKWFISLEVDMFRLKFLCSSNKEKTEFLKNHHFPGRELKENEWEMLKDDIRAAMFTVSGNSLNASSVYKLPFIFALDLVRQRKVLLRGGYVYVPTSEIGTVIYSAFRSYLSESLSIVKKKMYLIDQDQRIVQIIKDFDQTHTGRDYLQKKGDSSFISADQLPTLSIKSFPLCMKSLYDVVVKDHHLKHFGRLQLGLFFKGIGVPLEEATLFWRGHFTKKPEIDGHRFDKQYLYNIRHMYGKEGKRADYTPYSCMKVITSSVGPGDHHGCPFKHSDQPHLRQKLMDAQIPPKNVKEIIDLVDNHHYQIACQKYFEFTHNNMTIDGGVNHPNQYFEESREVLGGKKTLKALEAVKGTKTLIYADGSSTSQARVKNEIKLDESDTIESAVDESMDCDEDNDLLSNAAWGEEN